MSVTVDQQEIAADSMGLRTVGQVLGHVQKSNRLVINLLIDGQRPDLDQMTDVRAAPLLGHTIYIETAEPRRMARDVLDEVDLQLKQADRLKAEAVDLLQRNQAAPAMERLSGCFSSWHHAQETVEKTALLLKIDLSRVRVDMHSLKEMLGDFSIQLRQIRSALEDRDFVTLSDILAYETTQTSNQWQQALGAIRRVIDGAA
jgi:hypothetical protein